MMLFANVLKQTMGSIQRSPLVQNDLEFLRALATVESTTIDLLIGSDYFWDIKGEKVVLPSGMFLVATI